MSIDNYSELVTAVGDWLDRDDLAAKVPTFIQLAEARLNRLLEDPEMEVTSTTTATGDYTALPSDFGAMVSVSTGDGVLRAAGPVEFAALDHTVTGTPRYYTVVDGSISFAPNNSSAVIRIVYRRRIPALTASNTTNWLLTLAPDVYLYGALVQAEAFLAEDDRLELWKSAFDESIAELRGDASRRKWGAGPIGPRIRRP
jgi:hypothetical protein